jgi:hypothetical protein
MDFYLMTLPLPRLQQNIRIPLKFLSDQITAFILFSQTKSIYGLPHAGKIAQDSLIARLATHGTCRLIPRALSATSPTALPLSLLSTTSALNSKILPGPMISFVDNEVTSGIASNTTEP